MITVRRDLEDRWDTAEKRGINGTKEILLTFLAFS
jgi:hypothetical protein